MNESEEIYMNEGRGVIFLIYIEKSVHVNAENLPNFIQCFIRLDILFQILSNSKNLFYWYYLYMLAIRQCHPSYGRQLSIFRFLVCKIFFNSNINSQNPNYIYHQIKLDKQQKTIVEFS